MHEELSCSVCFEPIIKSSSIFGFSVPSLSRSITIELCLMARASASFSVDNFPNGKTFPVKSSCSIS